MTGDDGVLGACRQSSLSFPRRNAAARRPARAFCRTISARPFATAGMLAAAVSFMLLDLLPVDFAYWQFALIPTAAGFTRIVR